MCCPIIVNRMTAPASLVQFLSHPLTSYLCALSGTSLLTLEFLRPGWIVPGVLGGVLLTTGTFYISLLDWSTTAVVAVVAPVFLLPVLARQRHLSPVFILGTAFAAGWALFLANHRMSMWWSGLSLVLYVALDRFLRIAARARAAKLGRAQVPM